MSLGLFEGKRGFLGSGGVQSCLRTPRTGAGPALPAGAGSAQGRPQAGTCCAPVPKKATSAGSGSGSGPVGQRLPGASPTAPAMPCCQHPPMGAATPLQGHPSPQSHGDPTTSLPQGRAWGHCPPAPSLPQGKAQGSPQPLINPTPAPNRPPGLAREQLPHQGLARSRVTLGLAGTRSAAGGLTRIGPCTGSYMGLVSAWILTWDWAATGFSPGIGERLDSHLGLVSAWILTWDWAAHGFLDRLSQCIDSHTGLVNTWILTWDWSEH